MNIRIEVNDTYPTNRMKQLIGMFKMFHEPLNERTIIGCPGVKFARSIENFIEYPSSVARTVLSEAMKHVVVWSKVASEVAVHGRWPQYWVQQQEMHAHAQQSQMLLEEQQGRLHHCESVRASDAGLDLFESRIP